MENVVDKMKSSITRELAGQPEIRREIIQKFPVSEEKNHLSYLKDEKSIDEVLKLIKTKKFSNNQIKSKIKEFLNDPEDLRDFLISLLSTKSKKEESKEATSAGASSGSFISPLNSEPNKYVNKVPTVRESEEYCDSCDRIMSKCICKDSKKIEAKEATGAGSSGAYSQPAIWAKSMKKKDFAGYRKPIYKGGKFVQVKKKCKKFPYCNQGDIKALKIFENETVQNAIDSVSSRFGINKEYISDIVFEQIRKTQK